MFLNIIGRGEAKLKRYRNENLFHVMKWLVGSDLSRGGDGMNKAVKTFMAWLVPLCASIFPVEICLIEELRREEHPQKFYANTYGRMINRAIKLEHLNAETIVNIWPQTRY